MLSNQVADSGHAGFRQAFDDLVAAGELDSFAYLAPRASSAPGDVVHRELLEAATRRGPTCCSSSRRTHTITTRRSSAAF